MPVQCPGCKWVGVYEDHCAGEKYACPRCRYQWLVVPKHANLFLSGCPKCGHTKTLEVAGSATNRFSMPMLVLSLLLVPVYGLGLLLLIGMLVNAWLMGQVQWRCMKCRTTWWQPKSGGPDLKNPWEKSR